MLSRAPPPLGPACGAPRGEVDAERVVRDRDASNEKDDGVGHVPKGLPELVEEVEPSPSPPPRGQSAIRDKEVQKEKKRRAELEGALSRGRAEVQQTRQYLSSRERARREEEERKQAANGWQWSGVRLD